LAEAGFDMKKLTLVGKGYHSIESNSGASTAHSGAACEACCLAASS
jgi:uncharacterized protein YerC